jgi:predicted membrane-bound dolichyl-phosphate-mannose-protein mannosyltransferase
MQDEPSLFLSLLPFLIVTLIFFFFAIPISRRKGRGVGFAAWCLMPFVAPFILFYLVSLSDKSVLDRLSALEGKSPKVE